MSTTPSVSPRRYRRRILGLGALVFAFTFAVGAAIFIPIVQNDLEDRVEEELRENDIVGVTASFSGQDGTLVCADPLDDPEEAQRVAAGLWGVRVVDLDRTCVADLDEPATSTTTQPATGTDSGASTTDTAPSTEPALETIDQVVAGDPLFGQLSGLIDVAGLAGTDGLGAEGPLTLLAPTDAAFDAAFDELGADAFGALTSDPARLRALLLHHATEGRLASDQLESGPIEMLDGETVVVDADAITFTSGEVVAGVAEPETQFDIEASNGVIHAIDRLLVPPDLDIEPSPAGATVAQYVDGVLVLSGVVSDEEQQAQLLAAASGIDPANVTDELSVDPTGAPAAEDVDRLAVVVDVMKPNVVSGTARLEGSELSLDSVVRNAGARASLEELAATADIDMQLADRPLADDAAAEALELELNEFVAENPILFEQSSVELTNEANAVIEQVAARALRLDGVTIVIVGHTDTDGDADNNQLLSEGRAAVVRDALIDQGLDPEASSSLGRGEAEPIVSADGTEDKAASRRVEFVVEVR